MKKLLAIMAVLALASAASAEVLVQYTFTGSSAAASSIGTAVQTAGNFANSQGSFGYISTGMGTISPQPGVSTATWNQGTPTAYWSFSLTLMSGYKLVDSPDALTFGFNYRATGTGPTSWQLDADWGSGFSTMASGTLTANSSWQNGLSATPASVTGLADASGTINFRLYGYNAPSATGTWAVDNVTLNGTTTAIPEPATMSLLGLGALEMVLRRKMSK